MAYYRFKDNNRKKISVGKLVCLARTYKKHAEEMDTTTTKDPLLFLKPASSIIFNGESIIIPDRSKCLHHEVELGIVIGKKCKKIKQEESLKHVLGYLVALDITARDIQTEAKKNGWPWSISKGFDTFTPISEIVLKENLIDPNNVYISLKVNGKLKQRNNTSNMIYSIERIIEFISEIMTLEEGDLILTGTPEGVGEIFTGDILDAEIENECILKVNVKNIDII